jgi:hypothetical protein
MDRFGDSNAKHGINAWRQLHWHKTTLLPAGEEAVKTWCRMNPGKARLVQTPCSNSDADLYRAVAEAFGLDFSYQTSIRKLKEKVEYVIRFAGLMPVFDEAHFLLPTRFTANTAPMRLNWVRTQIVDRECPVALVTTPQTYKHCVEKFVKATGHNIDQFLGRTMMQAGCLGNWSLTICLQWPESTSPKLIWITWN